MIAAGSGDRSLLRLSAWLKPLALGASIGILVVLGVRLGTWTQLAAVLGDLTAGIHGTVGPVWIPMFLISLRVMWIGVGAFRSRKGRGRLGSPVRPELSQLAPLFAALGLCGTVIGLKTAFEALEQGDFLTQLPQLLGGLGTAMTSTLVGLGLQVATLLLGVVNPAYSWVRVRWLRDQACFSLDGRAIGSGEQGLGELIEALSARQPEALALSVDLTAPAQVRQEISATLWRHLDGAVPVREVRE